MYISKPEKVLLGLLVVIVATFAWAQLDEDFAVLFEPTHSYNTTNQTNVDIDILPTQMAKPMGALNMGGGISVF